jgi:hypothetical protein
MLQFIASLNMQVAKKKTEEEEERNGIHRSSPVFKRLLTLQIHLDLGCLLGPMARHHLFTSQMK